jgi:hypothetical protein
MNHINYIKLLEETQRFVVYLFSSPPGYFSDFFDDNFRYQITVLDGEVRIISNGKNNEEFLLEKNFIDIDRGEKFKLQNIYSGSIKILIVKYK